MTQQEREELRIFVGKNADYYISKWEEISENKISWNWAAFFFGLLWFGYRKMYPHAFGFMIFSLILQTIQIKMNTDPLIIGLTNLAISTFIGMFGNYLYYEYAKSKVQEIKSKIIDEKNLYIELARQGGASYFTAIGIGLMYLVASSIIEYGMEDKSEDFREQKSIDPWSS
ncbi:MAG TPA: DUF2628 domain-containing protein [Sulfurihydrogenibium sp.]|uniref:DUF2628 domain-containing protein n=1 Tax=Sulfurihydrogenibium sp. (strain YO3AOP1) TaxID=436114 RepID=UPI0001726703|nr:DUF2628 domain-containing protein [Sulfurihydrogenibium sp. YO3AOP1]ACD66875.1 hypothetical protein SYO3AOP1_1264 [Sulfurihydrogenibium sp. YO3AOP1]HBT98072.1 DUF2628 domain-containing protein [Sulfurihydrogenibium sp.]